MIKNPYSINQFQRQVFIQEHQVTYEKIIPKLLAIAKIEQIQEYM